MRVLLAFLLLGLAAFPAVLAESSAAFERDGSIGPGTFLLTDHDRYRIQAVEGETIRATLTWEDESAHLLLIYSHRPGRPGCTLGEPECVVAHPPVPFCDGAFPSRSPYVVELVAAGTGLHTLNVGAQLATARVPYHLTLEVGAGGADRVSYVESLGPMAPFAEPLCALRDA